MADLEAMVREYLARPYSRTLVPDSETNTFTAYIVEFPGCVAEGDSPAKAYERLEEAAFNWVATCLDLGKEIPAPQAEETHSGRILLRLPKSMHGQAIAMAQKDNTSLNQFTVSALAEKLGRVTASSHIEEIIKQQIEKYAQVIVSIRIEDYWIPSIKKYGLHATTLDAHSDNGIRLSFVDKRVASTCVAETSAENH